jgi:DNA end-binding protein Ku
VPAKGGEKAYALLREAIRRTGMVGIGKVTMRTNTLHLAGVKTVGDAIVLEVMRFANELVDESDVELPGSTTLRPQELQMAEQLIENLSGEFDPSKYVDDYRANLMKIIRAKMKGKKVETAKPEERETTEVIDLMARLKESLHAARGTHGTHKATHRRRHTAAKKTTRTRRAHRAKHATRQSA